VIWKKIEKRGQLSADPHLGEPLSGAEKTNDTSGALLENSVTRKKKKLGKRRSIDSTKEDSCIQAIKRGNKLATPELAQETSPARSSKSKGSASEKEAVLDTKRIRESYRKGVAQGGSNPLFIRTKEFKKKGAQSILISQER